MRHNLWKTKCPYLNIRQSHYGSCIRVIGDFGKAQLVLYPCRGKQPRITNYLIMLISDFLLKIGSVGNPVCTRIDLIKNFLDIDTRIFEFNLPSSIIAFSMKKKIPQGVWKRKRKIEPFFTGFHWFSQSRLGGPSVELRLKWIFLSTCTRWNAPCALGCICQQNWSPHTNHLCTACKWMWLFGRISTSSWGSRFSIVQKDSPLKANYRGPIV